MTVEPARALRFVALAMWAVFFHWLWWGEDSALFVGRRTEWVVPFGAIGTTLVALAYVTTVRSPGPHRLPSLSDIAATLALVLPIIAVMVVPNPTLGTFAADRKGEVDVSVLARPDKRDPADPVLVAEMAIASRDADFARERQIRPGLAAEIEGLVTEVDDTTGRIALTRFQLGCCAADALPYSVPVRLPADSDVFPMKGDWMRAVGTVARKRGGGLEVRAREAFATPQPSQPYL